MKKILFVKSIFCPNFIYYEATITSLIKILFYIQLHKINAKIILIGWINYFYNNLITFLKIYSNNIQLDDIIIFDHNYGKCYLFNKLIDLTKKNDHEILIYFDHDIYFDLLSSNIGDIIEDIIDNIILEKKIGLIALNHMEDNRHQLDVYENTININNNILCWSDTINSIACGAFIIKKEIFNTLSYFPMVSNYGMDDIHLLTQLTNQGYINIMIKNFFVVHPLCNDKSFENFKYNLMHKILNNIMINYDETVKESEEICNKDA